VFGIVCGFAASPAALRHRLRLCGQLAAARRPASGRPSASRARGSAGAAPP